MLKKVALASLACLAFASGSASATQIPSNLSVSATVIGVCTFTTPNAIAFGNVSSTSTQIDLAAVNIRVDCSTGIPYTIGMNNGTAVSGFRDMQSGGNTLRYNVFTDAARLNAFTAIGTGGAGNIAGTGTNPNVAGAPSPINVPIYPSILTQATPPTGSYTDTLIVTLQY